MTINSLSDLPFHLPAEYLEFNGVVPLDVDAARLRIGTWRSDIDPVVLDQLATMFGLVPDVEFIHERDGLEAIRRLCGEQTLTAENLIADLGAAEPSTSDGDSAIDDLRSLANEAPVIKLVNLLLVEALDSRASDVHLESSGHGLDVRYRIDGVLQSAPAPPASMSAAILSRLKIMAELDIAERRAPQDGRIKLRLRDRDVDVRVSTVPVLRGESMVLRLLDGAGARLSLNQIGMAEETLRGFTNAISHPHGLVLVTGPTGSGKTTTLYSAIEHIRTGREKILTVEDPVEYELAGIAQMAVNVRAGVTFASALRSLLRQDPDVILVGEIRDADTAAIAMQAALTGHLVLSTLHTGDAPGAITRLLDLGVPDHLIASALRSVLAQRLVRTVCSACSGKGCTACRQSGYHGRTGIYELLEVGDRIRQEIARRSGTAALRLLALEHGMRPLADDAERWIGLGITTREEAIRVTGL